MSSVVPGVRLSEDKLSVNVSLGANGIDQPQPPQTFPFAIHLRHLLQLPLPTDHRTTYQLEVRLE